MRRLRRAARLSSALAALACGTPTAADETELRALREAMVEEQLAPRGITDRRVLDAMRKIPRHRYAPNLEPARAYGDHAAPIGHGQTISQPYIVALMTQLARVPQDGARVLEVGTGSGYQAAVLGELAAKVFSLEILEPLATDARERLAAEGYANVQVRHGDGYAGWPEHAPFDAILVTAAAPRIPQPLVDQLKLGGHLVIPVGESSGAFGPAQQLEVHRKTADRLEREARIPVRFVPMTGAVRENESLPE